MEVVLIPDIYLVYKAMECAPRKKALFSRPGENTTGGGSG